MGKEIAFRELKNLNLMDRFLFAEAVEDPEIFETILEIILGKEVILKELPQSEKEKRAAVWSRQIKMDVYGIDTEDTVYNAEVQNRDTHNLPRRSRLYNSIIDSRLLLPGTVDFNELNDVYIIMIMPFDLFGEGKYKYTFRMQSEEIPGLKLADGATRIFLNTKGTDRVGVSDELIELLRYFETTTEETAKRSSSRKIRLLQEKIEQIKKNDEIGVKFMNAWEEKILDRREAFEEGKEEGKTENKKETAFKMKEEQFPYEVISKITGLSLEEIEKL